MSSISHNVAPIPSVSSSRASEIIEAGSLAAFLDLLGAADEPGTVLLMPIERQVRLTVKLLRQWAVHLTAARTVAERTTILYATFPAAECTLLGQSASLIFPTEQHGCASSIAEVAQCIQAELLACLVEVLERHARVQDVRFPARFRIADEWVWVKSELHCAGITFQHGHWTGPSSTLLMPAVRTDEKAVLR